MTVEVHSYTMEELLQGNVLGGTLRIPEYQRPYRWGEKQIGKLVDDLGRYHRETVLTQIRGEACPPYYVGSFILHKSRSEQGDVFNVIDGQQRLTTLAIIALLKGIASRHKLAYLSPESQSRIVQTLKWLSSMEGYLNHINLAFINVTLVITAKEDDAYRFFETENTAGVRLRGPDIIKAHHLRAVDEDSSITNEYARRWESLGDLNPVIDLLLKGRYWKSLEWRHLPGHRYPRQIRDEIELELAQNTGKGMDVAYHRTAYRVDAYGKETVPTEQPGYDLRQPLNSGPNTIGFLEYFEGLRKLYLEPATHAWETPFCRFYEGFVRPLEGCGYLKPLFDACLLLYLAQFGDKQLHIAAHKLFRVVYAKRVENRKAVREASVPSFVGEFPVLDWIASSYTPQQCYDRFDRFELTVSPDNLDGNTVKSRFVHAVCDYYGLSVGTDIAGEFGLAFTGKIRELVEEVYS